MSLTITARLSGSQWVGEFAEGEEMPVVGTDREYKDFTFNSGGEAAIDFIMQTLLNPDERYIVIRQRSAVGA